ncbi:MAG TPA: amine dehydrogenase large subunit [Castellaniella sp.]|nr:amine dehydrogenase large subunit [Castellaniella sp.]
MKKHLLRLAPLALLTASLCLGSTASWAQSKNQPFEKLTGGHSIQVDPADRVYVMDAVFFHLTDSRFKVFDIKTGKLLGMVPTAFNGMAQMSKDGKKIYITTTYFERVTRGKRSDVVEVWDANTLSFDREILLPPKRAGALNYDVLFRQTNDGQFVLLQNATPATSISVVDMKKGEFVEEITATAGCWSFTPVPGTPRSFTTVCGDGALLTMTLDENGKLKDQQRSKPMFSVKDDPVYISAGIQSDALVYVSFYGNVYTAKWGKDGMSFEPTWSLLNEEDKAKNWVPGGYNLLSVDAKTNRMYIFMHPDGQEGSHKNPAAEIWVYDLKSKKRIARVPGENALSMAITRQGGKARLLTIDVENVHVYDISAPEPKLVNTIKGAAETSLQVMGQPGGGNG